MNNIMEKLSNPFNNAWFVDNNKSTSEISIIDVSKCKFTIEGPREIIVKRKPYSNENFSTYSENGICECGQSLDQLWRFCPKCGGKLVWE